MDKLSGLASKFGGGGSSSNNSAQPNQAAGNEDYLDKGKLNLENLLEISTPLY
jgi:hypothetical protein